MPDENLLATLEQGLRQSRMTRSRLASRLADLEAEAERLRTELNEMDALVSQTEAAMFRILSSMFGQQQAASPSDAEIEAALRREAVRDALRNSGALRSSHTAGFVNSAPQAVRHDIPHDIPPIRAGAEPKNDRFFERTIPQATTVLLRE